MSQLPPTPPTMSKLFIRSEVLAVVDLLSTLDAPPKQDKQKQFKRLSQIANRQAVLDILVKELTRCASHTTGQILAELLMELGSIETLQEPLWELIRLPHISDEIKDTANLILRHLGDESDPELYLEYLEDPVGLISRETERMLEVSSQNPEALIDFIDFIFSLPPSEQVNLLSSLQSDYNAEHLINLFIPMMDALPEEDLQLQLIAYMGQTKSSRAAVYLHQLKDRPNLEHKEDLQRSIKKALNELKIAGAYKEPYEESATLNQNQNLHSIDKESTFHRCFATIPDGIGNQGLVVSRIRPNQDVMMMCIALSDVHGIIDCFGFYQLSLEDFNKIVEKFHEESTKIEVPPSYCQFKLQVAEGQNRTHGVRIPYEYSCWKILLDDVGNQFIDIFDHCEKTLEPQWKDFTGNLYQHPDFKTWFLEDEDHPAVVETFQRVRETVADLLMIPGGEDLSARFIDAMESHTEKLMTQLLLSPWIGFLIQRLADAAFLLHCQKTTSFSKLAATEVVHLVQVDSKAAPLLPLSPFCKEYGHRCIEEELLRMAHDMNTPPKLRIWVDALVAHWSESLQPLDIEPNE